MEISGAAEPDVQRQRQRRSQEAGMLEVLPAPETVVAIRVTGQVTEEDVERAIQIIEAALARQPRIAILAEVEISGLTAGAFARRLTYGISKFRDIKRFPRAAIVTNQEWLRRIAWVQDRILPWVEVRTFSPSEREEAVTWVSQPLEEPSAQTKSPERQSEVSPAFLDAFAAAWNRHDVDAILSMMTPDCVFEASRGSEVNGTVYVGQEEVRRGIEEVFATFPDARWTGAKHFITGDRGVSEWVFTGTGPSGRVEVQGCDVFTFRDGKIAVKNSFRKQRQPASSESSAMRIPHRP
jgi:ketosteroid isomerase-like protein